MALTTGTRLGHYEVVSSLGAGGAPAAAPSERSESKRSAWGCPPPLVAQRTGDQLRRGLAVTPMERSRAEAEGPTRSEKS